MKLLWWVGWQTHLYTFCRQGEKTCIHLKLLFWWWRNGTKNMFRSTDHRSQPQQAQVHFSIMGFLMSSLLHPPTNDQEIDLSAPYQWCLNFLTILLKEKWGFLGGLWERMHRFTLGGSFFGTTDETELWPTAILWNDSSILVSLPKRTKMRGMTRGCTNGKWESRHRLPGLWTLSYKRCLKDLMSLVKPSFPLQI